AVISVVGSAVGEAVTVGPEFFDTSRPMTTPIAPSRSAATSPTTASGKSSWRDRPSEAWGLSTTVGPVTGPVCAASDEESVPPAEAFGLSLVSALDAEADAPN